jgi:hypothetical protein
VTPYTLDSAAAERLWKASVEMLSDEYFEEQP